MVRQASQTGGYRTLNDSNTINEDNPHLPNELLLFLLVHRRYVDNNFNLLGIILVYFVYFVINYTCVRCFHSFILLHWVSYILILFANRVILIKLS